MVVFCPLFSGSSGNCTYLGLSAGGIHAGGVLIDAGVSCRAALGALAQMEIPAERVSAIVLTHSHSDHIRGLRVLAGRLGVPVYGSPQTLEAVGAAGAVGPDAELRAIEGDFTAGGLEFSPFATPHDAAGSLGFRIGCGARTVGFATDLGHITGEIAEALTGCDLVMLESNYDEHMLAVSRYPYALRQRIASDWGHLSNDASAAELCRLVESGTARLALAHLSRENNFPELARQTAVEALSRAQMQEGRDYRLCVCRREGPSGCVCF